MVDGAGYSPASLLGRGRTPGPDRRRTINAIPHVFVTECRWADLPKKYGEDSAANRRLRRWEKLGVWKRIAGALVFEGYRGGEVKPDELSIDSNIVRT